MSRLLLGQEPRHTRAIAELEVVRPFITSLVKLLLLLQLLTGLALATIVPAFQRTQLLALASDFEAFQDRVRSDEAGARILHFGGENPKDSYDQLMKRLWSLQPPNVSIAIGVFISITSCLSLLLHARATKPPANETRISA